MIDTCGFARDKPGEADLSAPSRSIQRRKARGEILRTGVGHGSAFSKDHQEKSKRNPNSGNFQENWTEEHASLYKYIIDLRQRIIKVNIFTFSFPIEEHLIPAIFNLF